MPEFLHLGPVMFKFGRETHGRLYECVYLYNYMYTTHEIDWSRLLLEVGTPLNTMSISPPPDQQLFNFFRPRPTLY